MRTFHVKMRSACSFIFMQIKVIFIRMVSHFDSLWNRGTRELENGLLLLIWKAFQIKEEGRFPFWSIFFRFRDIHVLVLRKTPFLFTLKSLSNKQQLFFYFIGTLSPELYQVVRSSHTQWLGNTNHDVAERTNWNWLERVWCVSTSPNNIGRSWVKT